jgi:dTDP-4-dehydro-2,3,6-trideoxy-D-glucose 4-aminotransferase
MINVFQPSLGKQELDALAEVFAGNWLGHGPRTQAFEAAFAEHIGVRPEQVIFINSATAGLFLAGELLGLGPADDVVMPSISFVAAANAVAATGARPVFCDVDPRTLNPTLADVEKAVTPRTKAVLLLHYGGYPGDVVTIARFCRDRGIQLIEDAACAVASTVDDQACGTLGDVAMWSFDAMKILVTGDGGMFYARDEQVAARARELAYHGLRQSSGFQAARVGDRWWDLNVREFGRRIVGNDVTAALGGVQLRRLPEFVSRRAEIALRYDEALAGVTGLRTPPPVPAGHRTSHYFYWIQLPAEIRDQVASRLLERGIYTTLRYPPLHHVAAYQADTFLPGTDIAAETTLLLPLHQGLDDSDVGTVIDEVRAAVAACT